MEDSLGICVGAIIILVLLAAVGASSGHGKKTSRTSANKTTTAGSSDEPPGSWPSWNSVNPILGTNKSKTDWPINASLSPRKTIDPTDFQSQDMDPGLGFSPSSRSIIDFSGIDTSKLSRFGSDLEVPDMFNAFKEGRVNQGPSSSQSSVAAAVAALGSMSGRNRVHALGDIVAHLPGWLSGHEVADLLGNLSGTDRAEAIEVLSRKIRPGLSEVEMEAILSGISSSARRRAIAALYR